MTLTASTGEFVQKRDYLDSSRPTAVNLSWALKRMDGVVRASHEAGRSVPGILEDLKTEAEAIRNEDIAVCRKIGEYGLSLIGDGDGILTHCNAGRLAAVRYGTATAPSIWDRREDIICGCSAMRPVPFCREPD